MSPSANQPPTNPGADGPKTLLSPTKSARRLEFQIAEIAERQHGLVILAQLQGLGLTAAGVRSRVEAGRLHRVHSGVYAVGHSSLTQEGRWLAGVLAGGEGAVLSHRSAAALWGLLEDQRSAVDVSAPKRRGRIPRGIEAHRHGSLLAEDRTVVRGVPCTTAERTLLDLAGILQAWELRRAIAEAEVLGVLDHVALRRLIKRSRGRRGVARLRMLLDEIHPDTKRTRSELERLFLRMCSRTGLPRPEVNVRLRVGSRSYEPDFLWRDEGLIIEADGEKFHGTHSAFQHDRRREQELQTAGWRVTRCTWEQVEREPHRLATTIRTLLAQSTSRRRA